MKLLGLRVDLKEFVSTYRATLSSLIFVALKVLARDWDFTCKWKGLDSGYFIGFAASYFLVTVRLSPSFDSMSKFMLLRVSFIVVVVDFCTQMTAYHSEIANESVGDPGLCPFDALKREEVAKAVSKRYVGVDFPDLE